MKVSYAHQACIYLIKNTEKNIVNSLYTVKNKINKMLEGQKYLSWANFIAWP